MSPTLSDLQDHLVQLQIYLRQRDEAKAANNLVAKQLESLEAQHLRAQELERARIKAGINQQVQQKRIEFEREESQRKRDHEIQIERERNSVNRLIAEERKKAQEQFFEQQVEQRNKIEQNKHEAQHTEAKESIERFMQRNIRYAGLFPSLFDVLYKYQANKEPTGTIDLSKKLREIEPNLIVTSDFLSSLESLGFDSKTTAHHLNIESIESLSVIVPQLQSFLRRISPFASKDIVPIAQSGRELPPWESKSSQGWLIKSLALHVISPSHFCHLNNSKFTPDEVDVLTNDVNQKASCDLRTWRIPSMHELLEITLVDGLQVLGELPKTLWINHADAPGRYSAVEMMNKKRITTGSQDKFGFILI